MHASKELSFLPRVCTFIKMYKLDHVDDNANLEIFYHVNISNHEFVLHTERGTKGSRNLDFWLLRFLLISICMNCYRCYIVEQKCYLTFFDWVQIIGNIATDNTSEPTSEPTNTSTATLRLFVNSAATYIVISCPELITICHFHMVDVHSVETIASVKYTILFNSILIVQNFLTFSFHNTDSYRVSWFGEYFFTIMLQHSFVLCLQ